MLFTTSQKFKSSGENILFLQGLLLETTYLITLCKQFYNYQITIIATDTLLILLQLLLLYILLAASSGESEGNTSSGNSSSHDLPG